MVRIALLLCAISLGMTAGQQELLPMLNECDQHVSPDMLQPADYGVLHDSTYLDSVIRYRMGIYHIPGAQTLALKNGQIIWKMPFGYAYVQDSIEVADTTVFTVMSVSKTMVAWAAMQLWERGVFGLDDDINDYLPFQVIHPLYPDSIITFRMLMAHTAGLRDCLSTFNEMFSWGQDSPIPLGEFLQDYFVPGGAYYFADSNFTPYAPGTAWEYCNFAIALLAYVVEYMADSFPVYCRDSIFDPLSMNKSCWFLSELDTMGMAMPYNWSGSYVPYGQYGFVGYPAGFLRTNTPELVRSLQAFMQHGQIDGVRILDSTTVEMMTTVQYPAVNPDWGLIWFKLLLYGRNLWGHSGGGPGFCTFQFYCPAENTGVIVLTNMTSSLSWNGVRYIADEIFDFAAEYDIAENNDKKLISDKFILKQNQPNPFKSVTKIEFELNAGTNVRLNIYDIAGRRIAYLVDKTLAPGRHSVDFDAGELPCGVYYYSLSCGGSVQAKPCVVLR